MARFDKQDVLELLAGGPASTGQLAAVLGRTRQAVHHHLSALRKEGLVRPVGQGRATRWERTFRHSYTWRLEAHLAEDDMWGEVREQLAGELGGISGDTMSCLNYGATEMLNNAIDHSSGSKVSLHITVDDHIALTIADDGVGAFRNVRERFGLPTDLDAIAHIAKGKQTTAPDRHSGQGLFFTSKMFDHFQVEANGSTWKVDNVREDMAVGSAVDRPGTRVTMRTLTTSTRRTSDVFNRFTDPDDLRFDRTTIRVALSDLGEDFISRSEAKRLSTGLEGYDIVVLDFEGVREVGQGFVDELFRVWARAHPGVVIHTRNASREVAFMIDRGLPGTGEPISRS